MPETEKSFCPLCDLLAQFERYDESRIRYYECPRCRCYAISEAAVGYVNNHPESRFSLARGVRQMPQHAEILEITVLARTLRVARVPRNKYS